MLGLDLAIRFSLVTNERSFCGPQGAAQRFLDHLQGRGDPRALRRDFERFEGLYPYLQAIAQKARSDFLDHDVVEAYWIGNQLLEGFADKQIAAIIRHLGRRGLPAFLVEELIDELPPGFIPHHNFNVFYVGVGRTTGAVQPVLENMDKCRISWGEVVRVNRDSLLVRRRPVVQLDGAYLLGPTRRERVDRLPLLLPSVRKGDVIAIHWGGACMLLNDAQQRHLQHATERVFEVMNRYLAQKT